MFHKGLMCHKTKLPAYQHIYDETNKPCICYWHYYSTCQSNCHCDWCTCAISPISSKHPFKETWHQGNFSVRCFGTCQDITTSYKQFHEQLTLEDRVLQPYQLFYTAYLQPTHQL